MKPKVVDLDGNGCLDQYPVIDFCTLQMWRKSGKGTFAVANIGAGSVGIDETRWIDASMVVYDLDV